MTDLKNIPAGLKSIFFNLLKLIFVKSFFLNYIFFFLNYKIPPPPPYFWLTTLVFLFYNRIIVQQTRKDKI